MLHKKICFALALLLTIAAAPALHAQTADTGWDGSTSTQPEGSGTPDDPFLMSSGANLKWLYDNIKGNNYSHFLQVADIDMGGHSFYDPSTAKSDTPRGIGYAGANDANSHPFQGVYDGNGYEIRNLSIPICALQNSKNTTLVYGLFGYVLGAKLRNMVLNNVHTYFTSGSEGLLPAGANKMISYSYLDLRVGTLVGSLGGSSVVENIIIKNSSISDGGYIITLNTIFCGGVVGEMQKDFFNMDLNAQPITMRNVFADVDINFGNINRDGLTDTGKWYNYCVGGILGRGRKLRETSMPKNVVYKGEINAPWAFVGPLWGLYRAGDNTAANNQQFNKASIAYSGEYGTGANDYLKSTDDNETRYFYNYRLRIGDVDALITDVFPPNEHPLTKVRTINPLSKNGSFDPRIADHIKQVQGVNHANYIDLSRESGKTEILTLFNDYIGQHNNLREWAFAGDEPIFSPGISASRKGFKTFEAKFSGADNPTDYSARWTYLLSDGRTIDGPTEPFLSNYTCLHTVAATHPDNIKTVEVTLVRNGSDIISTEVALTDPVAVVLPTGETSFKAERLNSEYPDADYIFAWYGNYDDGAGFVRLTDASATPAVSSTYDFGSKPVPATLRVVLCDYDGRPIGRKDKPSTQIASEVRTSPTTTDWSNFSQFKITATMEEVAGNLIPVAYITDAEGNVIAGGVDDHLVPDPTVRFQWQTTDDLTDENNWKNDYPQLSFNSWGTINNRDTYHRVTYYIGSVPIATAYASVKRIVFVYNKAVSLNHISDLGTFDNDKYPDGDDSNSGWVPTEAVRTMNRAFSLLVADNAMADNIIVVMGYNDDDNFWLDNFKDPVHEADVSKSSTIQGSFGRTDFNGTLRLGRGTEEYRMLRRNTTFRNITLSGGGSSELLLYCRLNDLTFDEGVRTKDYLTYSPNTFGIGNYNSPRITIVAGFHNYDEPYRSHADALPYPATNAEQGLVTITLKSGHIGRMIAGSRNNSRVGSNNLNVFAHPVNPHRVKVNIDGPAESDNPAFPYMIGIIVGGQTDGSVYTDAVINMDNGSVGRFIAGNISYGRNAVSGSKVHPADGFFGSTVLNLKGGNIGELIGGTLGRMEGQYATVPDAQIYFYGRSIINIGEPGGSDKSITVDGNVYGAGAGGVMGLGSDYDEWHHTDDQLIPYFIGNDDINVRYGPYATVKANRSPVMHLLDGTDLDLANSYCEVNVYSGTVKGNIFGGGLGYSGQFTLSTNHIGKASTHAGYLYGHSKVSVAGGLIEGSVYGGAAGHNGFELEKPEDCEKDFTRVACIYGDTQVDISGGIVKQDVYAGSMGIEGYPQMAAIFGTTQLNVSGGTIYGNIYGGSSLANMDKLQLTAGEATTIGADHVDTHDVAASETAPASTNYYLKDSGSTYLNISGGVIGNNIFGGSRGEVSDDDTDSGNTKVTINGDTHVTITGGEFLDYPYTQLGLTDAEAFDMGDAVNNPENYRSFNIYGGGNLNCDILGTAFLNITSSLLVNEKSILPRNQNPNALTRHNKSENFQAAYMDLTFRRFCVYGGGFGLKTNVLNTDVRVSVSHSDTDVLPHGYTLESPLPHQSFFDIAGGGYNGDVGYWATIDGTPSREVDLSTLEPDEIKNVYHHYVGGQCSVIIDRNTFNRKLIGGGFYGSCWNTHTRIVSGSMRQVYGGSLLGYVYRNARLHLGNRIEDYIAEDADGIHFASDPTAVEDPWHGDVTRVPADVYSQAVEAAENSNRYIFVTENIYGGNDVKGIIGTTLWLGPDKKPGIDLSDGGPLFTCDVNEGENNGINFNIYGGTYMGNIYGAGNGHYRGYFVPESVRYTDGPDRMYRNVKSAVNPEVDAKAYRSRPMVGNVNVSVRGNSATDPVRIHGNFFGGGSECTIGAFNTILPLEDPRRLSHGGNLRVNLGSNVIIDGNLYMGNEGQHMSEQLTVPPGIDLDHFNPSTTKALDTLGDVAYYHWYFDTDRNRYLPGYPLPGKVDGNYGMTGEHMLYSFKQNVMMEGDVELTFYKDIFERNEDGSAKIVNGEKVRKRWVPGEIAMAAYDATNVSMNSFYLGGLSGSMSNNNVMLYCYDHYSIFDPTETNHENVESRGSIYRIALPPGVTIKDKVVMGSERARSTYQPYADRNCTQVLTQTTENGVTTPVEPTYVFDGGIITQQLKGFDLMVYNAVQNKDAKSEAEANIVRDLPEDYYTNPAYSSYTSLESFTYPAEYYDPICAGVTIYRKTYSNERINDIVCRDRRYDLATVDAAGTTAFTGQHLTRESRIGDVLHTVSKLTARCNFELVDAEPAKATDSGLKGSPEYLYGGNIYGGCYESGIVMGDIVMNIGADLLGNRDCFKGDNPFNIGDRASMRYNIGRVFGGGFGKLTKTYGNTFINLLNNFRGLNVFGGGMEGDVIGTAHVNYIGTELGSYIYGNIFGGGLRGTTGANGRSAIIRLYSGNVNNVYGGSCMGNMDGRTFIEACDRITTSLDYLNYEELLKQTHEEDWGDSRLIAGSIYGGNDIAGTISISDNLTDTPSADDPEATPSIDEIFKNETTGIWVHEEQESEHRDENLYPGGENGYIGFPLIGEIFAGSNGNYGSHDDDMLTYEKGSVMIAVGSRNEVSEIPLGGLDLPHIDRARLQLNGGSVINAYGGGDMCNITDATTINVDYPTAALGARAGFASAQEMERVWNVLHFNSNDQQSEIATPNEKGRPVLNSHVFRLFGGNNRAPMAIQPTWILNQGYVGSLYSGGNFGKMTYCDLIPGTNRVKGLSLTVDARLMHVEHIYGGGRIGAIDPDINGLREKHPGIELDLNGFYGATLDIRNGVINHVYGGNDVAGFVEYGTDVKIEGAISGDIYCAGNGNYLYYYDADSKYFTPEELAKNPTPKEMYTDHTRRYIPVGSRFFVLPPTDDYKAFDEANRSASTVLAINSARPHVRQTRLSINGKEDQHAWVHGSVFCGGNSSTVLGKDDGESGVEFNIGNYVYLNGVFMGSNGHDLADGHTIDAIQELNNINVTDDNLLTIDDVPDDEDYVVTSGRYPHALDLYMRAVEMHSTPRNFDLSKEFTEAYIGDFCVGGNRGSLVLSEGVDITFPESLVIYNSVIGGCKNSRVNYGGERGVTHRGGVYKTASFPDDGTRLVNLHVKSLFAPVKMITDLTDPVNPEVGFSLQEDNQGLYPDGICNVIGGCFQSGSTYGDINIDLYSDLVGYSRAASAVMPSSTVFKTREEILNVPVNKAGIITGMKEARPRRNFTVVGAGWGHDSYVLGNTRVNLLPGTDADGKPTDPSAAIIFGGAKEGSLVGNSTVAVRDGKVLANVYGASEAARMYGSTAVIVGYPEHYIAQSTGVFALKRSDYFSETSRNNYKRANGTVAMAKTIALVEGDIVPHNVYDMIIGRVHDSVVTGGAYETGFEVPVSDYDFFTTEADKLEYFHKVTDAPANWDDIEIWIGDQGREYLGQGNIYGGGFQPGLAGDTHVGESTVLRYTKNVNPRGVTPNIYGGNTAVMVWDNPANALKDTPASKLRDHVTVGTFTYRKVTTTPGADAMTYYKKVGDNYVYQTAGRMTLGETYYEKIADGGIYGGGRKVFAEGFRSVDLAYYGYAEHSPQNPKLLNTLQRASVATVTDCCLELVGAADFNLNGIDAELFSINRVDELGMMSSLSSDENLQGYDPESEGKNLLTYSKPRSRNYIGLVHPVHDLASLYSNWSLTSKYHDKDGEVATEPIKRSYFFPDDSGTGQVNLTSHIISKYGNEGVLSYLLYKHDRIEDYYKIKDGEAEPARDDVQAFSARNVGTSANMIGITSKFALRVQGHSVADGATEETSYFGPAYGIYELKLLSGEDGEGGGYVYTLNHHYDEAMDGGQKWHATTGWMSEWGQDFMMTSANFVYPGAPFGDYVEVGFMADDCMPDGVGYDVNRTKGDNVNDVNEQHFWFVRGTTYRYAMTITGVTADVEKNFYVDNSDNELSLFNVTSASKLRMKEVIWYDHSSDVDPSHTCDLQDTDKDYRLYFTVDHNTRNLYTTSGNGAYVAELPRETVTYADDTPFNSSFGDYTLPDGSTSENFPNLGIRLYDNCKSRFADQPISVGRDYYEKHLKMPHYVQFVLEAENPSAFGGDPVTFRYIVDLDIRYMLGPMVDGDLTIENTALPGEYIFINANNIEVDMAEDLEGIQRQFWRLYPNDSEGNRLKDADGNVIYRDIVADTNDFAGDDFSDYIVEGNEYLLHVPAYYYMNGWEVTYCLQVGAHDAEVKMPFSKDNRLTVYNYHRMLPLLKSNTTFDQHLTAGARVYLEDLDDLAFLLGYLVEHQDPNTAADLLPDGKYLHPASGEGINFFLCTDLTMPTYYITSELETKYFKKGANSLRFRGNFHGDGYSLTVPSELNLNLINGGAFYNTGFISEKGDDDTKIFANDEGLIQNCFYFNTAGKGSFLGATTAPGSGARLVNCYQNTTNHTEGLPYNELLPLSSEAFRYGMATYNLNGFYLTKRHLLLHGTAEKPLATANNTFDLLKADTDLKAADIADYNLYDVDYIENYYNNGDYRFAAFDPKGVGTPTALRTARRPNYFDESNKHGSGSSVTNHNVKLPQDEARWNEAHGVYHPLFDEDYIFFGENLTVDVNESNKEYPTHITSDNRVFRVGGFYGSAIDKGYFFNREAFLDSPLMTAVDFVGYRDRTLYDASGYLTGANRADLEDDGWIINNNFEMYCPPALDLPWTLIGDVPYHDFSSFTVNTDVVTNNLLVYTRANDHASSYLTDYHYQDKLTVNNFTQHSDAEIYLHHIVDNGDKGAVYGGYFHLKDGHNFNAPVAFTATTSAWYDRKPDQCAEVYKITENGIEEELKTGWEGICLPFTVGKTYAATTDLSNFAMDMGEITHFFGDEQKNHEYWLRRFIGPDKDNDRRLVFERPTAANMKAGEDKTCDYIYTNNTLSRLYRGHGYNFNFDRLYHFSDDPNSDVIDRPRTINNYRLLSEGVPYIVTYPGESFYEFDLSGKFYAHLIDDQHIYDEDRTPVPQKICYIALADAAGIYNIPVTDEIPAITYSAGGYTMAGTFMRLTDKDAEGKQLLIPGNDGTEFVTAKAADVLPFRSYIYKTAKGRAPKQELLIGGDKHAAIVVEDIEEPEEPEEELQEEAAKGIEVWGHDGILYVRTPAEVDLHVYNTLGQTVRVVRAYEGTNSYSGLVSGVYIVARKKVKI